jgi:hypothetical protein
MPARTVHTAQVRSAIFCHSVYVQFSQYLNNMILTSTSGELEFVHSNSLKFQPQFHINLHSVLNIASTASGSVEQ